MGLGDDHRRGGLSEPHKALPPSEGRGGEYEPPIEVDSFEPQSSTLFLSWCYTELGQGKGISKHSPVPFLVLHRVRAGEGSF